MFKNVASQSLTLYAVDASTGLPKTGDAANMVFYVSKDDGTVTAIAANSGVPTEIDSTNAKGLYKIALAQGETNADKLLFSGKSSTSNIVVVPAVIYTDPPNFTTTVISSGGVVGADATKINGSAPAAANLSAAYAALETGTAQGGGASTITLRSGASATNDFYKSQAVFVLSGTGAGQTNNITGYVGATKVATVETAWATQPDNTSVYVVIGRIG